MPTLSKKKNVVVIENMKYFITGTFEASFTYLEKKIEKEIGDRFGKMESEVRNLKDSFTKATLARSSGEPSTITKPSNVNIENHSQKQQKVTNKKNSNFCSLSFGLLSVVYQSVML